ncbi:hypothetical protein C0585_05390 [Candidatus Woesearchaeota archaeon]|mgnify:CR=1 FL=1|nr:MAG: hypothetical protein C0585_05390 [Candidatus Woesearchaeota archaeon]
MKIICFALGNIWRFSESDNRADLLEKIQHLDIEGVELTIGTVHELENFELKKSQIKWLKQLKYVSIHAPFKLLSDPNKIKIYLDKLQKIYDLTNAKTVIIHPDNLPEKKLLKKYSMHVSTENMVKRKNITIPKLKKIIEEYGLGLCLDVAHSYFWSEKETKKLIDEFKEIITQVHFSNNYRRKDHLPFDKVSKSFLRSINPLKDIEVPIIIEEDIKTKDFDWNQEISNIKKILND